VLRLDRKGMVTIATTGGPRHRHLIGGNPEFMAKQECVKKGIAQPLRAAQGKVGGTWMTQTALSGTTPANEMPCPPTNA